MGIPKFASLIRTKYRSCWNNPGDIRYDRDYRSFIIGGGKKNFRHLHIDGNSLLHMAFQFTFGYGGKAKLTPEHKKFIQTASYDEIFNQAVQNFCNSIDNMVESLQLEGDVFLVFDGPAPLAKMVQQRQRRYGKYYSAEKDPAFQTAMKKEMDDLISGMRRGEQPPTMDSSDNEEEIAQQILANKVGKSSNVVLDLPPVFEDVTNRPFPNGGKFYVKELAGADSTEVLENLVAWSKTKKRRWTNILNPKAPHTIEVSHQETKHRFLCVFHAAVYTVYKEDNPNDILLDGLIMKPELFEEERNKYRVYFEADGFQIPASESIFNSQYFKLMDVFERTRESFMRIQNSRIINAISKLTIELANQNPLFREVLIRTGDSILRSNENNLNWLMEIRRSMIAGEQQRRMFGQEEDLDSVLDKLIKNAPKPAEDQESTYNMEDIYFAEEDDQTHLNSKNFDSNCLTPGTSEMKRISTLIRKHYDIKFDRKAAYGLEIDRGTYRRSDGRGRKVDIYFSDSDIPGEGEQKLMQLFRSVPFREMDNREMDLFYGLDADLFVLTVIRHGMFAKYHCGLLREEEMLRTNFMPPTPKTSSYAGKGLTYHIVDIGKLTSMIRIHPYDFAFLTFMFGNDFLPRSPIMSYETTVFEEAMKVISEMTYTPYSKLLTVDGDRLQIQFDNLKLLMGRMKKIEERSIEGLYKMYEQEKRLRESNRLKTIDNLKKEMVPLKLKYDMVLRSTVVSQIWKVDGIDETVKRTNDISYDRFRSNWESHVASSFPGYNDRLTTVKKDIVKHACEEYLAGLNWVACYYFDAMGRDTNTVELPKDVILLMHPQHAAQNPTRMIRSIAGHYETEFRARDAQTAKTIDKDMAEGIIERSREFLRDKLSLDNAASNDSTLTRRCCWDTTVYADMAVINTVQSSAYYRNAIRTVRDAPFMIAVDMTQERFDKDQSVYFSSDKYVPDLYFAVSEMAKTNHYVHMYVLVHTKHMDDLFYEQPEIVAENEEFRLLKLSSVGNDVKRSTPTTVGKDRLSPFWYYPYLSSPLIATVYDRLASMENPQQQIETLIQGNHIDMNSRKLESLSTVNSRVQCYAVLPPQSGSLYASPLLTTDPSIWQFPVSVTTRDYNFKGWVHEGALSVPYVDISQLAEAYDF